MKACYFSQDFPLYYKPTRNKYRSKWNIKRFLSSITSQAYNHKVYNVPLKVCYNNSKINGLGILQEENMEMYKNKFIFIIKDSSLLIKRKIYSN